MCDCLELNARGSGAISRLIAKVDGLAGLDGAVGFLIRKDQVVIRVVSVDLNGGKCDSGRAVGVFKADAKMDVPVPINRPA